MHSLQYDFMVQFYGAVPNEAQGQCYLNVNFNGNFNIVFLGQLISTSVDE
jgi:hypothetical protein